RVRCRAPSDPEGFLLFTHDRGMIPQVRRAWRFVQAILQGPIERLCLTVCQVFPALRFPQESVVAHERILPLHSTRSASGPFTGARVTSPSWPVRLSETGVPRGNAL